MSPLEDALLEFASMMHHNYQHPTWEYGEDRDPCPYLFDWVKTNDDSDVKFAPVLREMLEMIEVLH